METLNSLWSRYLTTQTSVDLLEGSLVRCVDRLESLETQLALASSRGVKVRAGVGCIEGEANCYREGLDKLHISKQLCKDKVYSAFYDALTEVAKACVEVLPCQCSKKEEMGCEEEIDKMGLFIEFFGGLTGECNKPGAGHYLRVADLVVPPKSSAQVKEVNGLFVKAIGAMEKKEERLGEIMKTLHANLGMGFPLQKSIDSLQVQTEAWAKTKHTILKNLSLRMTEVLDEHERCLEPLERLGSAFQDDPEILPLDCISKEVSTPSLEKPGDK